ncbi:MAG: flagellar hook protein FlgE [Deltaproteobacteria bacterium]|jgi:flagellar hook protein FlgE|nr:flagellar hook protein FlgE [Deltaproteobacteria bacterium]
MIGSLFAGISGLNVNSKALTVIGDNIANVNTTAFKSNRSSFANILSQSLAGTGASEIGRGVEFWGITPMWSQGSVENTANPTDMAINGAGFFVLRDNANSEFYTRAGDFTFDRDGYLINPDGLFVQGYEVTTVAADGTMTLGNITDINVPGQSTTPPHASSTFTIDVNLDAGADVLDTYSSTVIVYDSLGNGIPVTLTFEKQAVNSWDVSVSVPAGTVTDPATDVVIDVANYTFDGADGSLLNNADPQITLSDLISGADDLVLVWDLVDAAGVTHGDLTQYASPSTTTFQTQDGYPSGVLRGVSVDEFGVVTGSYSNGQLTPLYQVLLADFPNYYGLSKMGKNLYAESRDSGQPLDGVPQSGRLGSISPSAIEMSNVDLAQEFVKMITTQRAFQANSRVITASDEILAELINIKR